MGSRQRQEKFWVEHVSAWRGSGMSQVRYCEQAGLNVSSLKYWSLRAKGVVTQPLNLVPVQRTVDSSMTRGCLVRGPSGVTVVFAELPSASYLMQLLGAAR